MAGAGAGSLMRGLVLAVVAAAFLVPLWAIGELGVWAFAEPRSHLVWDEATGAPDPADEPGGTLGLAAQLAFGPVLVALAWSVQRVQAGRAARARGGRDADGTAGRGRGGRRLAP